MPPSITAKPAPLAAWRGMVRSVPDIVLHSHNENRAGLPINVRDPRAALNRWSLGGMAAIVSFRPGG